MNVLMVDDEPFVLEYLEYLIKSLYPMWILYKAGDSSQALELCRQVEIELAFLDIELPGRSGLEIAEELKKLNSEINIVILTAHQDFSYAQQSIKIGVADYLTKPIIEDEVITIIHHFSKNYHANDYSTMILNTLDIVEKRYGEKLSLAEISEDIHVNTSYLSRKFKQETGLSFSDYLNNYRLEKAKLILSSHPHDSISKVAEMTGFSSLHYFSSSFKKKVGMAPKQFQQNVK